MHTYICSLVHTLAPVYREASRHIWTHAHTHTWTAVFLYAHKQAYRRSLIRREHATMWEETENWDFFFSSFQFCSTVDTRLRPRMQPKRSRVRLLTCRANNRLQRGLRRLVRPAVVQSIRWAKRAVGKKNLVGGGGDKMKHWSYWRLEVDKLSSAHAHNMVGVGTLQEDADMQAGVTIFIQIFFSCKAWSNGPAKMVDIYIYIYIYLSFYQNLIVGKHIGVGGEVGGVGSYKCSA